uniref:Cupin type-1 domain-containing protein n=1 Tax=Ananas comosus var. bracteatus TaxID=296719 RepID=A0A6V7QSQ7_ANACO
MGEVNEALKLVMVLLLLLASLCFVGVKGYVEELQDEEVVKERGGDEGEGGRRGLFMLGKAKKVVETAGGEVRVVSGLRWKGDPNPMHIGFISMEPNTLFIPQYIDSDLVLFVKSGEAKVGWIYKDKMVEKHLKKGDVNVISAGSAFYVVNTGEGQKLHVICSIDTSESIGHGPYESFFVGGGRYPTSVLAGFDTRTLTAAFNISSEELAMLMRSQRSGPIIYMNSEQMDQSKKSYIDDDDDDDDNVDDDEDDGEDEDGTAFSWRKMLGGGGGDRTRETERGRVRAPHAYNLYAEKPSFENSYGWSIAIDEHDYAPLKHTGVGVYLVNLTAGSMMAPHLNPRPPSTASCSAAPARSRWCSPTARRR